MQQFFIFCLKILILIKNILCNDKSHYTEGGPNLSRAPFVPYRPLPSSTVLYRTVLKLVLYDIKP